jgi:hypothetical protein
MLFTDHHLGLGLEAAVLGLAVSAELALQIHQDSPEKIPCSLNYIIIIKGILTRNLLRIS